MFPEKLQGQRSHEISGKSLTTVFMDTGLGARSGLALPQGNLAQEGASSSGGRKKTKTMWRGKKRIHENTIQ
jgi:hypothetical protein